ncbi:BCD family MFS transporter [Ruegeria profundi]|uniref:Bacteriochlorophyll synthase n=1 Tax=Ruegeria profundi TaxID=1685378 RepID=A0A0X3TVU2_9RHOB|nr:BCD family MFS transporter [Ruegeria profundi]KUJ79822.1 bacteriochlorophyll synthase [Ruegeria profundi]
MTRAKNLSWIGIVRLGLVQMCLGSIVVLTTSTLNRLMVVELALPAILPGLLVGLHYGIQISRPHWGVLSDATGRRTPWIVLGMAILVLGALGAAFGIPLFNQSFWAALTLSILSYTAIGLGVGASGTSLLALLATTTEPRRRAAAATITWLMMIAGIAITAASVGAMLDPYSPRRLLIIVALVGAGAVVLTSLAVWRVEVGVSAQPSAAKPRFRAALREVWADDAARRFTVFVFLSMTAFFMQELILEPYAGLVFGFTPGESTSLSGAQNGGVFLGMLSVGIAVTGLKIGSLRGWVVAGCLGSAASLGATSAMGQIGPDAPLVLAVVVLGFFNGMFAVAAIGAMMELAGEKAQGQEGTRMGLWGAAQAIAAGFGGLVGAAAADLFRSVMPDATAFGAVFLAEAALFVAAAILAAQVIHETRRETRVVAGE